MPITLYRVLYRVVSSLSPTADDFRSFEALGRPCLDPAMSREWSGVSHRDSFERAAQLARRVPNLGGYIAELRIPDDSVLTYERTTRAPGHWTVWGDSEQMRACVVSVTAVPVPEERTG